MLVRTETTTVCDFVFIIHIFLTERELFKFHSLCFFIKLCTPRNTYTLHFWSCVCLIKTVS